MDEKQRIVLSQVCRVDLGLVLGRIERDVVVRTPRLELLNGRRDRVMSEAAKNEFNVERKKQRNLPVSKSIQQDLGEQGVGVLRARLLSRSSKSSAEGENHRRGDHDLSRRP